MLTQAHEPEPHGPLTVARLLRVTGHDHLAAVGRRADPGRGVDGEPDVVHLVEGRVTAVDPDADPSLRTIGPRPLEELALDGDGGVEGGAGALEHREELVGPRLDGVPGRRHRRLLQQCPHVADQPAVLLTQPIDEARRVLDVGHEHGEEAGREGGRFAGPALAEGSSESSWLAMNPRGTIPCFLAAVSSRFRACSRATSSSKWTWLNRARALRTWAASWIGSRRRPREST